MNDGFLRVAPVAIPIGGSILAILLEAVFAKRAIATILCALSLVAAAAAALGGAAGLPGFGSEMFGLDRAGAILTASAAIFALGAIALAGGYLRPEEEEFPAELCTLLVLVPAGIGLVAGARHLMTLFLGIELLSVPLYALVGLRRKKAAAIEGALKYFLLGAFAAGFIAYGISLLFAAERTLDLAALRGAGGRSAAGALGAGLVAAGLLFKISAAPFHFWTPDAYQGAATPITALMAASTKIAAVAGLLAIATILPQNAWPVLAGASILSIAAGNLGAFAQSNIKRLLAYSSVAHAGTILLAIAAQVASGNRKESADATIQAAVYYLAGYGASVLGAFGILGILERGGERFASLSDFRGLAHRQPLAAWLFAFFLLSLAGIPPTAGFWAKYLVFAAAIREGFIVISVAGVLLSVIGAAYYLRVIGTCFMESEDDGLGASSQGRAPGFAWLAVAAAAVAVVALGLMPADLLAGLGS